MGDLIAPAHWRNTKRPDGADPHKWVLRKIDGRWLVWRPSDREPVCYTTVWPEGWKPDCEFFIHGLCRCSDECRR